MQVAQKRMAKKTNKLAVNLLVSGLVFRSFIAFWLYPSFDEAYYYVYSLHPDWSYFDHPLLVAFSTGFGPWLTGNVSQFTIRLGALILHTGSLVLLYLTSSRLFSVKAATLTLAIATVTPIYQLAFGTFTLPDNPLIFFWSASLYCAVCEFFKEDFDFPPSAYVPSYRLAILSVLVGLACLSKYHGFILGFGLVGFCLTSKQHRNVFRSPWTWLGVGLFLLTISPILYWNMQHGWVSFLFQSERAVPKVGYNFLNVLLVCLVGIGYLFPTIGFPLWRITLKTTINQISQVFSKNTDTDGKEFKDSKNLKNIFILWLSLPLILGFNLIGGYRQILPAWSMPGFWVATLLLGQQTVIWYNRSKRSVWRWLVGTGVVVSTILLFLLLHITTGTLQKPSNFALFGGFVAPQNDPSSTELIDIQQVRRGFAESEILQEALKKSNFIFTNRYYYGGLIAMALHPISNIPITCFDIGYDIRGFAFWSKPDEWLGKDALYITTEAFTTREDLMTSYKSHFNSFNEIAKVPIKRGGIVVNNIYVYQAKTLLKPYPRAYGL
ncbi:putative glycosyl transferase [Calothrix sp. NIES-4071]|nr:putative glycosyl transferase [Calothrix sp. NIES-4071]BAZ63912.1 putative glycosyl transferase [Calothrix sp. NIES-4105]